MQPTWELDEHAHRALAHMQATQAKRAKILCSRCGCDMIAWSQEHVTKGRMCQVCLLEGRILMKAHYLGVHRHGRN